MHKHHAQAKKAAFCYRAPITKHSSRLIQQVECAIVLPTYSNLQNRVILTTALTPPDSQEVGVNHSTTVIPTAHSSSPVLAHTYYIVTLSSSRSMYLRKLQCPYILHYRNSRIKVLGSILVTIATLPSTIGNEIVREQAPIS